MAIMAEHIQKLVQEIRSNAITSVIGGQFNRTRSGTSIQIDPTTFGGGGGTPEQLTQFVRAEFAKYAKVIKDAGIKPE